MLCLQFGVHDERQVLVRVRHHLDRPGVGAGQAQVLLHHPARDVYADAGFAGIEPIVVDLPQRAPAGVEEDRVTRLDVTLLHVLLLQGGTDIGDNDLLAGVHHAAFQCHHVDEVAAGEQRLQLLHAEFLQAVPRR